MDPPEVNREFARRNRYEFPLLCDPEKDAAKAFGALNTTGLAQRWTFLIDREGVIRAIDRQVVPGTHGRDVLRKLEELKLVGE